MKGQQRPDFDAYAGDLFGEIMLADTAASAPVKRKPLSRLVPGLAICAIASAAAAWLSQNYGVPIILAGLLLGLALNFAAGDPRTHDGLDAVSRHGLRVGIVLLGLQITAMQVAAMGGVETSAEQPDAAGGTRAGQARAFQGRTWPAPRTAYL